MLPELPQAAPTREPSAPARPSPTVAELSHTGAVPSSPESHVTILLSTFNGERWLPALLDSIRAQTHGAWTLLVRDDGSTDRTNSLIDAAASDDARVRRHDDDLGNLGPAASFMTLLGLVESGCFAFCDQDDEWLPDKLEQTLAAMPDDHVAAVYTDATPISATGEELHPSALTERGLAPDRALSFGHLLINNAAIGATMLGTAGLARRAVALADDRPVLMHDWWVALVAAHQGSLVCHRRSTLRWRRHDATVTGGRPDGIRGRTARRREYLRWSIDAGRRLSTADGAVDDRHDAAARAIAALDPAAPGVVALCRLWSSHGVRAWPMRRQWPLLLAVTMGRSAQ